KKTIAIANKETYQEIRELNLGKITKNEEESESQLAHFSTRSRTFSRDIIPPFSVPSSCNRCCLVDR
ncbi:hypothetical protein P6709_20015, partial [Jeotgalibacillus sp. ET6]|uniref:hypothetical protein n=1 Tax=Jeotgalibacillus sp. ET6 TaxID=3037260 RepID=UPI0024188D3E